MQVSLLYSWNVIVPVGLKPPASVAVSKTWAPTAPAETWVVSVAPGGVRVTTASSESVTVVPSLSMAITVTMSVWLALGAPVKLPSKEQV